jgi:hypothetical protein
MFELDWRLALVVLAGHRCDTVTRNVMDALRKSAGNH